MGPGKTGRRKKVADFGNEAGGTVYNIRFFLKRNSAMSAPKMVKEEKQPFRGIILVPVHERR